MDIIQKIESALDGVIQWFTDTPEFADGQAPESYVIVNIEEKGGNYSESENRCNEYFVSLNVFTKRLDFALYERLKTAMYGADFVYIGGGNVGDDKIFPYGTHYYLDFSGVLERDGEL